jgi:formylglycine-generating enzyme required for sulfatase activity
VLGKVGKENAERAGSQPSCKSAAGAFDMVGNVWEWTDETVRDGVLAGIKLPSTGYVLEADADGVPAKTGDTPSPSFGGDHIWTEPDEVRGVFRGGFWSLNDRAGVFTMNATQPTSFVGVAVGFRCAKDVS